MVVHIAVTVFGVLSGKKVRVFIRKLTTWFLPVSSLKRNCILELPITGIALAESEASEASEACENDSLLFIYGETLLNSLESASDAVSLQKYENDY